MCHSFKTDPIRKKCHAKGNKIRAMKQATEVAQFVAPITDIPSSYSSRHVNLLPVWAAKKNKIRMIKQTIEIVQLLRVITDISSNCSSMHVDLLPTWTAKKNKIRIMKQVVAQLMFLI